MKTFVIKYVVLLTCLILIDNSVNADFSFNYLTEYDAAQNLLDADLYFLANKLKYNEEKIDIKVYYEVHCFGSREFLSIDFKKTVEKLNEYLEIKTYPYGNAKTVERNGKIEFICQHGPKECYGNKLHACALDIVKNHTSALLYDSCMASFTRQNLGSDDTAADKCGAIMGIDSSPIKKCAKGDKGNELLKYYGEESKKANFDYVPYILVNGKVYDGDHFLEDICAMFSNPPPECAKF